MNKRKHRNKKMIWMQRIRWLHTSERRKRTRRKRKSTVATRRKRRSDSGMKTARRDENISIMTATRKIGGKGVITKAKMKDGRQNLVTIVKKRIDHDAATMTVMRRKDEAVDTTAMRTKEDIVDIVTVTRKIEDVVVATKMKQGIEVGDTVSIDMIARKMKDETDIAIATVQLVIEKEDNTDMTVTRKTEKKGYKHTIATVFTLCNYELLCNLLLFPIECNIKRNGEEA